MLREESGSAMNRAERRALNKRLGNAAGGDVQEVPGGVEAGAHVIEAFVAVLVEKLGYELVESHFEDRDGSGAVKLRGCRFELEGDEGQRVSVRIMDEDLWSSGRPERLGYLGSRDVEE